MKSKMTDTISHNNRSVSTAVKSVILVILASWSVGFLLLIAAESIPVGLIIDNVGKSHQRLIAEGDYPLWGGTKLFIGDNVTDAAMIQQATYDGDESAIDKAMLNYMKTSEAYGPYVFRALDAVGKNEGITVTEYPRYWHGYLIFLKPLLLVFNIHQIRTVNMIVMTSLMLLCAALIQKGLGTCYLAVFITSIVFINPVTSFFSFQFSPVMYIMLLMLTCIFGEIGSIHNVFLMGGILCAYFDLLTYPVVALGVPLIFAILLMKGSCIKAIIKTIVSSSVLFSLGYALMWFGKWIISAIVTGNDILGDAVRQIVYRAGTTINEGDTFTDLNRLDGLKMNYEYIRSDPVVIVFAFIFALSAALLVILMTRKRVNDNKEWICGIAIVSLFPFAWYIAVLNHSYYHPFITYRDFSIFFTALMSVVIGLIDPYLSKESNGSN